MKSIKVKLKNEYEIIISNGKKDIANILSILQGEKVAIITDSNVEKLYGNYFDKLIEGKKVYKYIVKAGEKSKNANNFITLLEKLSKDKFTRKDSIIAFGGGMIGDLAGFVASSYLRGISYISVPTTLLSMIDSSVGGKTGINGKNGKNIFGAFYQPKGVYIDLDFLSTLSKSQLISGLGEALKYKYICLGIEEKDLLQDYESLIYKCLSFKKDIVEQDEKENDIRKVLNFGHTVGHAIEKLSNMKISHGESVAKGIAYSLAISEKIFKVKGKKQEYNNLANKLGIDISCSFSAKEIAKQIEYDKKKSGDKITFVLLNGENKVVFYDMELNEIEKYLG